MAPVKHKQLMAKSFYTDNMVSYTDVTLFNCIYVKTLYQCGEINKNEMKNTGISVEALFNCSV